MTSRPVGAPVLARPAGTALDVTAWARVGRGASVVRVIEVAGGIDDDGADDVGGAVVPPVGVPVTIVGVTVGAGVVVTGVDVGAVGLTVGVAVLMIDGGRCGLLQILMLKIWTVPMVHDRM